MTMVAVLAAIYPVSWLQRKAHGEVREFANAATAPTEGVHEWTVTKLAASAFNARRISYVDGTVDNSVAANRGPKLVKRADGVSTDAASGWNYVGPCTAITDIAIGVVDDSPAAIGDPVTVQLLGHGPTKIVFAEEALAVGQRVCVGASGGVRLYKGSASGAVAGYVGVVIGSPSNQAGDVVEISDVGYIPVADA